VPRIDKMVKAHFVQFWERKDEIMAMPTMKQFALALVINLFMSTKESFQFQSLAHDIDTCLERAITLPIDSPRTKYHNAKLSHDCILYTIGRIICNRHKV